MKRIMGWCVAVALVAGGCSSAPKQTTRMTHDDFVFAATEMAEKLNQSDFLDGRTSASEPVVVLTNKVENLSSDIITPAEQWAMVARVQNSRPMQVWSGQKNVKFILPPERRQMVATKGVEVPDGGGLQPTHAMSARITSSKRFGEGKDQHIDQAQDYYFIEFQLTDMGNREVVWNDSVEFKREARGLLID